MLMTSEIESLMNRARERMAEQDAHSVANRLSGYKLDNRYPEFCGAFRELLDMLVAELEREHTASALALAEDYPQRASYVR